MSADQPTDTSDMVAVHEVFRRVLGSAPAVLARVDVGDDDRVAVVASYFANVLAFLHVHHEGEDLLLWPKLLDRVPDPAPVWRIAAQHQDVTEALTGAEGRLGTWSGAPTDANAVALAAALESLGAVLSPHLAEEEELILPLAAVYITAPEWGELPAHGMANFTGDKLWLILGLIFEAMTPAQARNMIEHMPPPAVQFWTTVGQPQFEGLMATVRG